MGAPPEGGNIVSIASEPSPDGEPPNFDLDSENDEPNDAMLSESESGSVDDMGSVSLMREEVMQELLSIATTLGGDHHKNQKILRKAVRATVSEIYSPPRVTAAAARLKQLGIDPGAALDLTTVDELGRPWDFSKKEMQHKAEALLDEQ